MPRILKTTIEANGSASRSAMRTLDVLDAYRQAKRPLSLSELAKIADIPTSTCHGVMRALAQHGYLYFVNARDAYPTQRLWDMAETIREHDPIALQLEPELAKLRDEVDETILLGTRQGDTAIYLLVLESRQAIRYSARVGDRKPLHSSSIGKVMLASLPPEQLDEWISGHKLNRITANTITRGAELRADLLRSAKRGWFTTRGETVPDVMAVAVPIRLGNTTLAVAVAGPTYRMHAIQSKIAQRLMQRVRHFTSKV